MTIILVSGEVKCIRIYTPTRALKWSTLPLSLAKIWPIIGHNLETVQDRRQVIINHYKSNMSCRLVPKSVTLNDPERRNGHYFASFRRIRGSFRGPLRKSGWCKWLFVARPHQTDSMPRRLTPTKHDGRAVFFAVAELLVDINFIIKVFTCELEQLAKEKPPITKSIEWNSPRQSCWQYDDVLAILDPSITAGVQLQYPAATTAI